MSLVFLLASVLTGQSGEPYAWPLDLPRQITSSFAEYRSGRFHAGIDLRTGPVGKPVYAAGDGQIVRVRCSPYGYGKAVYLRLNDGNHVVYGHLDAFEGPIVDYVRAAQHARQNYTVDLYPDAGQFPVQRGDLIARSGDTGVGVPHLHYEFRNASNEPVNPKLLGIDWPDTTRPSIRRVVVAPQGPASRVNGDIVPVVLDVTATGTGEYRTEPISVFGTIGAGVDVIDPANEGANRLGIHILRSDLNGDEVFRVQHDRISYETNGGGAVAYHPYLFDEGRFLLAWRWPGNNTYSYQARQADGWIEAPLADSELRLTCVDFHGNTAAVTIPLESAMPELAMMPDGSPGDGRGTVSLDCTAPWLTVTVSFSSAEPETPRLVVGEPLAEGGQFIRVNDRTYRAGLVPATGVSSLTVGIEHPRVEPYERRIAVFRRGQQSTGIDLDGVQLRPDTTSAFGVLFASLESGNGAPSSEALIPRSGSFRVWPANAAIDDSVTISVPLPDTYEQQGRLGLYRRSGSGWSNAGGSVESGRLVARTSRFGEFAVFEDAAPPYLYLETPAAGAAAASARPAISGRVEDAGSGLRDITVHCGEQWLLVEYDPEEASFEWMADADLPSGAQTLTVRAVDNAGNVSTIERSIQIP